MCMCVSGPAGNGEKMDYLTVGGQVDDRNVDANQLTVTSVISGNLALYEVRQLVLVKV